MYEAGDAVPRGLHLVKALGKYDPVSQHAIPGFPSFDLALLPLLMLEEECVLAPHGPWLTVVVVMGIFYVRTVLRLSSGMSRAELFRVCLRHFRAGSIAASCEEIRATSVTSAGVFIVAPGEG